MLVGLSHEEERTRKNTEKDIGMLFLQRYAIFHKCYQVEYKLFVTHRIHPIITIQLFTVSIIQSHIL